MAARAVVCAVAALALLSADAGAARKKRRRPVPIGPPSSELPGSDTPDPSRLGDAPSPATPADRKSAPADDGADLVETIDTGSGQPSPPAAATGSVHTASASSD